jgi:hypothetical protein
MSGLAKSDDVEENFCGTVKKAITSGWIMT